MKRMRKILLAIALCIAISASTPISSALADVRVTVTFAVGGAAGGLYFFFSYSSGYMADWQNKIFDTPALLNYSPEGWQVKPPLLQFTGTEDKNSVPYAEIIRIRF
jgi:hypothetical protein